VAPVGAEHDFNAEFFCRFGEATRLISQLARQDQETPRFFIPRHFEFKPRARIMRSTLRDHT
jgi:hypothetical protein